MNCRFCNAQVNKVFADLAESPPSNSFLNENQINSPEAKYPLKVLVNGSIII